MAALYNTELNSILDQLVPFREIVRRPRPSDHDCHSVKRLTRRLERAYSAASRRLASDDPAVIAAKAAWYVQRRSYRQLLAEKR